MVSGTGVALGVDEIAVLIHPPGLIAQLRHLLGHGERVHCCCGWRLLCRTSDGHALGHARIAQR